MNKTIKLCISSEGINVVDAMRRIEDNGKGVLYIVDDEDRILGSVSDGDIRRWIINTGNITENISRIVNKNPIILRNDQRNMASKLLNEFRVRSLPIVDDNDKLVDIVFEDFLSENSLTSKVLANTPIIIMAGGKGTRLYPYTKILPKPLIPIGETPILERIMDQLNNYGADRFFVIVNYKKEMIRSYFADRDLPYDVVLIDENEPLGTAGGIRLIREHFDKPVIVTNCDILIKADYGDIIGSHISNNNEMTIVSSLKNINIPYGVLESGKNGRVASIQEKPQISRIINTGMYVIDPKYIEWIPKKTFFHMTQLAEKMIDAEKRVSMYPISENSFLDMGEIEEMKRMERILQMDEII